LKNDGIFNYATSYYYRNPNLGKQIPTLSNADYLNFKQFLKLRKFWHGNRASIKKHFGRGKKKEKSTVPLLRNTNNFLQHFKSEETLLDKTKKKLKAWLSMKSLNDTNIKKVLSIFYKTNSEIKKSVSILNDSVDYENILKIWCWNIYK
jgi:carboxyl-terminal processing protease